MPAVIDLVRHFVRQHDLIKPETRVVAAVSGGSDSVALAHLVAELARRGELCLVGFVHFNHRLRASADSDEQFVRRLADTLGQPLATDREDVAARARRERRSLEDAARAARHAGFERARLRLGADVIALGHTKDDQAETFLLRLVRGAGPRGLASMHPRNGRVVRPLLECRREELREWLRERQIAFVEDETNVDVAIPRNRVRAELMPLLAARFNPGIVDVLANEAELARELWSWLEEEAAKFGRDLEVDALTVAHPALRRLVLWRAMTEAAGGRPVSFDHVRAALRQLGSGDGAIDVPGHRVQRIGGRIVLTNRAPGGRPSDGARADRVNLFHYPLSIPGEVVVVEAGCVVSAEVLAVVRPGAVVRPEDVRPEDVSAETVKDTAGSSAMAGTGMTGTCATLRNSSAALVRGDLIGGTLAVRNRRPGDRFHPVGLNGSKKLQDLFVDRKIARHERDAVPLVVDADDRIVWVAGFGIDEAFRVTDAAQSVLLLRLTPVLGGPA